MTEPLYHSDNHAEAAKLAALGYEVFPLKPGDKAPATANGFNDATTDLDQIERWWRENPNYNVGLHTKGLVVIDQDGPDGKAWMSDDPDKVADLAMSSVRAATPADGWHTVFQQPPGVDWSGTTGKLAKGLDTRANGGYICVYPTTLNPYTKAGGRHCPGGQYKWFEGQELDIPKADLPYPPAWLWQLLEDVSGGRRNSSDLPPFDPKAPPRVWTKDEIAEIYSTPALYANQYWQKVAYQALIEHGWQFHSGPMRNGEIRLTRPGKNPKDGHSASWSHPAAYDRKWGTPRFRIHSAAEMEDWDAETSYSPYDIIVRLKPEKLSAIEFEMEQTASQLDQLDDGPPSDIDTDDDGPPPDIDTDDDDLASGEEPDHPLETDPEPEPPPTDDAVPPGDCPYWNIVSQCRKDGFIQRFWKEATRQEWVPQPAFKLAGALVAGAAVLGRKVATGCGETTSISVLALGGAGTGKNTVKSLLHKLLGTNPKPPPGTPLLSSASAEAGSPEFYGQIEGMPHSDSGLHAALYEKPCLVHVIDELGTMMESGTLNPNGLQAGLLGAYAEVLTVGMGIVTPRPKADRKQCLPSLHAPIIALMGFSQPEKAQYIVNRNNIVTGMTPRTLVFEANKLTEKRTDRLPGASLRNIDPGLVRLVDDWRLWIPMVQGDNGRQAVGQFVEWCFDEEAVTLVAQIDRHYDLLRVEAAKKGTLDAYLYTRAAQMIKRLALVFAMDELEKPPSNPHRLINAKCVTLAAETVDISMNFLLAQLNGMVESPAAEAAQKAVEFLKAQKKKFGAKDPGSTRTEIRNAVRMRVMDTARGFEDVHEIIAGCENAPIRVVSKKHNGKVSYRYFHR